MPTKVFISWSGDLSRQLGEAMRLWLPTALQAVVPYFSPNDIDKGTKWDTEISSELEATNIGIICLTADNILAPWILFEAGALSKSLAKARVCTLLFGLEPTDVKPPLSGFQATKFDQEDFRKLFYSVNEAAGDSKLATAVLEEVFETNWPRINTKINAILDAHKKTKRDGKEKPVIREDREILEEVLGLVRQTSHYVQNSNFSERPRAGFSSVAISDLITGFDRVIRNSITTGAPDSLEAIDRIERAIGHLCDVSGRHEEYSQFRSSIDRYRAELDRGPRARMRRAPIESGPTGPMSDEAEMVRREMVLREMEIRRKEMEKRLNNPG